MYSLTKGDSEALPFELAVESPSPGGGVRPAVTVLIVGLLRALPLVAL